MKEVSSRDQQRTRWRGNWRSLANISLDSSGGECETAVYNCLPSADIGNIGDKKVGRHRRT